MLPLSCISGINISNENCQSDDGIWTLEPTNCTAAVSPLPLATLKRTCRRDNWKQSVIDLRSNSERERNDSNDKLSTKHTKMEEYFFSSLKVWSRVDDHLHAKRMPFVFRKHQNTSLKTRVRD